VSHCRHKPDDAPPNDINDMTEFKTGGCGYCSLCPRGCNKYTDKLNNYDWLADLPDNSNSCDIVEVQFKASRRGYYINSNKLHLEKGDVVAVEASPGHDIGTVTMTGRLVPLQIKKANLKPDFEYKRIYRKVKPVDMDKYHEAKKREHSTMIESRKIAEQLELKMKIGDVEYQGDGSKAIFYYIADDRVDFRQLIKVLAERFKVRIEMKQIGARQEAGRIGGIGPCGRELCCATWMTSLKSVSTSAARFQDISLNPQKLAGQCAKLKCCLNFEVDQYVEALKQMPSREISVETKDNEYFCFRVDILRKEVTYSTDKHLLVNECTIPAERAFEVIRMNQAGIKPERLSEEVKSEPERPLDLLADADLNRFDSEDGKKKKRRKNGNKERRPQDNMQNKAPQANIPAENNAPQHRQQPRRREQNAGGQQPQQRQQRPQNRNNRRRNNMPPKQRDDK